MSFSRSNEFHNPARDLWALRLASYQDTLNYLSIPRPTPTPEQARKARDSIRLLALDVEQYANNTWPAGRFAVEPMRFFMTAYDFCSDVFNMVRDWRLPSRAPSIERSEPDIKVLATEVREALGEIVRDQLMLEMTRPLYVHRLLPWNGQPRL